MRVPCLAASLLSIGLYAAMAQTTPAERLQHALRGVAERVRTAPLQAYTAEVDITSILAQNGSTRTERVHQAMGAGRTVVSGNGYATFEDTTDRVVIMDNDKVVYLYDHIPTAAQPAMDQWAAQLDHLLGKAAITVFKEYVQGTDSMMTVEITLHRPDPTSHLHRVRYEIATARHQLRSVLLTYAKGALLSSLRYDYRSFITGTLDPLLQEGALAQVHSNGRPLPRFSGHRFVDLRKRSTSHARR